MKQGATAYLPRAPSRGWAYPWAGGRIPGRVGVSPAATPERAPFFRRRIKTYQKKTSSFEELLMASRPHGCRLLLSYLLSGCVNQTCAGTGLFRLLFDEMRF